MKIHPTFSSFSKGLIIFCQALEDEPLHVSIFMAAMARASNYIGIGLANLVALFTPDRIALGGGMINSWCLFEPIVREAIRQNCGLVPYQRTIIAPAALGLDTGLLGAAQVWFQRY
jgi:glucokinase